MGVAEAEVSPTGREEGRGDLGEGGAGDRARSESYEREEHASGTVGTKVVGRGELVKKMR